MKTREQVIAELSAPGAPFELRTEDVLGEQLEVFARRHRSLGELLRASQRFGDVEYLVTTERRLSFTAHLEEVAALAQALRQEHGVRPGDRIALCAMNCPEWIVAFWATVSLGAIAVGMNSMWAGPELEYALALTEPKVLIADQVRRDLVTGASPPILTVEEDVPAAVVRHRGAPLELAEVREDDPAVILFTSGTSGRPKGVTHSHRNVLCAVWFHLFGDAVAAGLGRPQRDRRYLLATPLFHIAALHNLALVRLAVGDTAVLHLGRFDIDRVLRLVAAERVTNWGAVPTMLTRLIELGDRIHDYDVSSLRNVSVSSAPSSAQLKAQLRAALPGAAGSFATSYGMTESSTAVTMATPAELVADPETVGTPIVTMQVQIRDAEGHPVPDGVEGEIHARGAQLMLGYWNNPEATDAAFAAGRWYRSGDLGTVSQGLLRVSSRRSDLILRGGENIYPAEVEHRIITHPAVRECAVVGIPDADFGQVVAAIVVIDPGADVTQEQLRDYTLAGIARYKVPTAWTITTERLPRNATGKVNRTLIPRPDVAR